MTREDLARLVARVTHETLVAPGDSAHRPTSAPATGARCGPPGEVETSWPSSVAEVARTIDHTQLRADATAADVGHVCREATHFGFAAVCVNPYWVKLARSLLRGSAVSVGSVVGFPLGAAITDVKQCEARRAVLDGATELDMVINVGAVKMGDLAAVEADIVAVVGAGNEAGALTKVIVEAELLSDEEIVAACVVAQVAGAHYVKTSTGFGPGGATTEAVRLMRRVVGAGMGVKAAGGIRDFDTWLAMCVAGASRVGASRSVAIVQEAAHRLSHSTATGHW